MDDKEILVQVGNRIREIRESKGIHQAELARLCDRERSWMARIEKGNINSTILVLHRIASALEVGMDELLKAP